MTELLYLNGVDFNTTQDGQFGQKKSPDSHFGASTIRYSVVHVARNNMDNWQSFYHFNVFFYRID